MLETEQNSQDIKSKIRQRYLGVDPALLDVIPAKPQEDIFAVSNTLNVAVYARVSTGDPRQTSSYELQKNHYTDFISRTPNWKLVKIYADEGISGTSLSHRDSFLEMIRDCRTGAIDLIVTKTVARFARNVVDCMKLVRELLALPHPVGVFFETEHINTFDPKYEMALSMIATIAQEESHTKSEIMNSSIEMRFQRGIFLTPPIIGYDRDDDGNLIINEEEAQTIRLIYKMTLNGNSCSEIAEKLTTLGLKTKRGRTVWNDRTIRSILSNERYCGDVLARKTFTPNYLDHKSKRNRQDRNQYRQRNHHEAIIPRDEFEAVQRILAAIGYKSKIPLPDLAVISEGLLKGFISINPRWPGFRDYDYLNACKNAYGIPLPYAEGTNAAARQPSLPEPNCQDDYLAPSEHLAPDETSSGQDLHTLPDFDAAPTFEAFAGEFDLRSFEVVHSQFFSTHDSITVMFKDSNIIFNPAAIRSMDCEFVELMIHPLKKLLLVRPSQEGMPNHHNALQWVMDKQTESNRIRPKPIRSPAFLPAIYDLLKWNPDCRYQLTGTKTNINGKPAILFSLKDFESFIPIELLDGILPDVILPLTDVRKKHALAFPAGWEKSFGTFPYLQRKPAIPSSKPGSPSKTETFITYRDPRMELPPKEKTQKQVNHILTAISRQPSKPPDNDSAIVKNDIPEASNQLITDGKEQRHE
jgi:DNA invertase Pin-like site-specific DNA recombinase